MTRAASLCVPLWAVSFLWLHGLVSLAQEPPGPSKPALDLKRQFVTCVLDPRCYPINSQVRLFAARFGLSPPSTNNA